MGLDREDNQIFLEELQRVLQHLYDPAELRQSVLLQVFGVTGTHNPPAALRRMLINAIQSLKPSEDVPAHTKAWRVYHVLTYRYVEQLSQLETGTDLAISIRQLRRLEKAAIQVLADYLCDHYHLERTAHLLHTPRDPQADRSYSPPLPHHTHPYSYNPEDGNSAPQVEAGGMVHTNASEVSRKNELEWLRKSLSSDMVNGASIVEAALKTSRTLAHNVGVQITHTIPENIPAVSGPISAIRQAILNLLTAAVQAVPGGQVNVTVESISSNLAVRVQAAASVAGPCLLNSNLAEMITMTRQLAEIFNGNVELLQPENRGHLLEVVLTVPASEMFTALVVDDNADTLRLFQRYLSGTRYAFVGARDPDQALSLVEEVSPQIVVMDVMLPGIDGWELLGRFREHPKTRSVPVIICTILPQEQLAMTLGAAGFIRKPANRESLLKELDRQVELTLRGSP